MTVGIDYTSRDYASIKQDMIDMKDYLIVTTYAICKNRLNKSYDD